MPLTLISHPHTPPLHTLSATLLFPLHEHTTYMFTLRIPYELACVKDSHLPPVFKIYLVIYVSIPRKIRNLFESRNRTDSFCIFSSSWLCLAQGSRHSINIYGMNWPRFGMSVFMLLPVSRVCFYWCPWLIHIIFSFPHLYVSVLLY